jgi:hypothetical protein
MHGLYIYSKKGEPHVIEVGYFVKACWVEKKKFLLLMLLLRIDILIGILCMPKTRKFMFANIL